LYVESRKSLEGRRGKKVFGFAEFL